MANEEVEKKYPPAFDIRGIDISKVNPAGRNIPEIAAAQQKAIDQQEILEQALEDRYKKINYFKLAEAFAKPQLGGFLASLGSAAGVLGEQAEAERAIAPTVARMRAETAILKAGLAQRTEQERAISEYDRQKKNDPNELRRILSLDPKSDIAVSIKDRLALEEGRRAETSFGIEVQKEFQKNPSLILTDPRYMGEVRSEPERLEYVDEVNNGRPRGIHPSVWNRLTFPEREAAIAKYANAQIEQGMQEGQKSAVKAEAAHDVLDELTSLRKYAVDPKLKQVFAVLDNGDLFSQFRAYLSENPGKVKEAIDGLVAATLKKLSNVDETTRAKFDALVKGIAEVEMRLRGTLNNPTDAATELSRMRSPSLANSQAGFLKIIDVLGLNAFRDIEMNNLRYNKGLTQTDLLPVSDMRTFRNETRRLREELADTNPLDVAPSWFYPDKGKPATKEVEIRPAPTAAPTSAAAAPKSTNAPSAGSATTKPSGGKSSVQQQLENMRKERDLRNKQPQYKENN